MRITHTTKPATFTQSNSPTYFEADRAIAASQELASIRAARRPKPVHFLDLRLHANAGVRFPACYARTDQLDMSRTGLPVTPMASQVTCLRCRKILAALDVARSEIAAKTAEQVRTEKLHAAAPRLLKALQTIAESEQIDTDSFVCDFDTLVSVAAHAIRGL